MADKIRRKFTAEFKRKVVSEALKKEDTLVAIAKRHNLRTNQIIDWKKQFIEQDHNLLENPSLSMLIQSETDPILLYEIIGRLTVENRLLLRRIDTMSSGQQ